MAELTAPPAAVGTLTVRELTQDEYNRAAEEAGGPLSGWDLSKVDHLRMVAAFEHDRIIAYWTVAAMAHAEPVWFHESARGRPVVARQLLAGLIQLLQAIDCQVAFGVINDVDFDTNLPMARKLGFEKVPGDLYVIKVPAPAAGEET